MTHLNLFDDLSKTTPNDLRQQRRATHVFILALSVALGVLVVHHSIAFINVRLTVVSPTREQYEHLPQLYSVATFHCPCSQVSMVYSSFVDFTCDFHAVCASEFLSDFFLQQLFEIYNKLDLRDATHHAFTLHGTVFSHFQALRILCDLVTDAVHDAIQHYLTSSFISASMIERTIFEQQTNASLAGLRSTMPNEFLGNLQLLRGMVQSNAFVSLFSSNWYPVLPLCERHRRVFMQPQYYNNCNCLASASCIQPANPSVPGYVVGCTPLEALLQSTIACLYDQSCMDRFAAHLNLSAQISKPLDRNATRFSDDGIVGSLVQQMFIETCSSNVSYDRFFEQCHPLSCSVTLTRRNSLITVVTTLLGLYGGLSTALKLIVPVLVFSAYKIIRRHSQRSQIRSNDDDEHQTQH